MFLKTLNYIVTSANTGSVSKAAKALFVSPSSIQHAIRSVEKEYGFVLFNKTEDGLILTEDGERYKRDAELVVRYMNQMDQIYKKNQSVNFKKFRIASQRFQFATVAFRHLIEMEPSSAYEFSFVNMDALQILNALDAGTIDLGVCSAINMSSLEIARIMELYHVKAEIISLPIPFVISLREGHPIADLEKIDYKKVSDYPLILFDETLTSWVHAFSSAELVFGQFKKTVQTDDVYALQELLLHTDSLCVGLPKAHLFSGVKDISLAELDLNVHLVCLHQNKEKNNKYVEAFVHFLSEEIKCLVDKESLCKHATL